MASTKIFFIYFMFVIFFNIFAFSLTTQQQDNNLNVSKYFVITQTISKLNTMDSIFSKILSIALIPFILLDLLFFVVSIISINFSVINPVLNILILSPLGIMAIFDYIVPMVRGN